MYDSINATQNDHGCNSVALVMEIKNCCVFTLTQTFQLARKHNLVTPHPLGVKRESIQGKRLKGRVTVVYLLSPIWVSVSGFAQGLR